MLDISWIKNQLEYLFQSKKISEKLNQNLLTKLKQNDKRIVSIFRTLEWSANEEAILDKLNSFQSYEEAKVTSNFSTETSIKPYRSRPASIIVPFNRSLKYFLEDKSSQKSLFGLAQENNMKKSFESKPKKQVKIKSLPRFKFFHDLKFESDEGDILSDDGCSDDSSSSSGSISYIKGASPIFKQRPLSNIINLKGEVKVSSNEKILEKKMSIEEILEKYQVGLDNEENGEIKEDEAVQGEIEEDEFIMDDKSENNEPIPVINRRII